MKSPTALQFKNDLQEMKEIVKADFSFSKAIFFWDFTVSAVVGWALFIAAMLLLTPQSAAFWGCLIVASLAHYRALSFIHEVAHNKEKIPRFQMIYNLLAGYWYGTPAYTHFPHNDHHNPTTFGSIHDPEYVEWSEKSPLSVFRPFIFCLAAPLVITARFCLLPLVSFLFTESFKKTIFQKFSTFAMQANYERDLKVDEYQLSHKEELWCAAFFLIRLALSVFVLPYFLFFQLLMLGFASFLNSYRAMVAHRYQVGRHRTENDTNIDSYREQALDSVTIDEGFLAELWAPVGLRYHSLHHIFPTLPYYALGKAHAKLKRSLGPQHFYHQTIESSFWSAITKLYKSCQTSTEGVGQKCS